MHYRMIVAGGRDFTDEKYLEESLDSLREEYIDIEIISGHANGTDSLAEEYAKRIGLELKIFPADWQKYGRAAGPIRNRQMLQYIREGNLLVVAFWDGQSRGTKNMIEQAQKADIECKVFMYPPKDKQSS